MTLGARRPARDRHPGPDAVRPPRGGAAATATWSTSSRRSLRALGAPALRPFGDRAGPQRRLDPPERERDRLARRLPVSGPASAACAAAATGVALPAQLGQALAERRRGRVGGQLGERGVERDQHLQRGLALAPVVEVEPSAQRELLAGERPLAAVEHRGQARLGAGAPSRAGAAAAARSARGRRSTGRRRPARRRRSRSARPAPGGARSRCRYGSAVTSRKACSARLSTARPAASSSSPAPLEPCARLRLARRAARRRRSPSPGRSSPA